MSRTIYQCPQCGDEWSKPHCPKCADEREAHSLHRPGSAAPLDVRKILEEEQARPSHCGRKMMECTDGTGNVIHYKCFLCGIRYAPEKQPNDEFRRTDPPLKP